MAQANNILSDSLNSSGSAMEEYQVYLDSIEGKIQGFKTELQILSSDIINSDWIKNVVDFGTSIVSTLDTIIDKFGLIQTILPVLFTGFSFKGMGKLKQNTPSYAPLYLCA